MAVPKTKVSIVAVLVLTIAALLAGCSSDDPSTADDSGDDSTTTVDESSTTAADEGFKIGFLLPDESSPRWETQDRPQFEATIEELCPTCEVLFANASLDASEQQQQAESMLTQGAAVLVVAAVDSEAAASIVNSAKAQNVPVVSYDRRISSPDLTFALSGDFFQVGELQGEALVEKLQSDGVPAGSGIVMINGAATDTNAVAIRDGALSKIEAAGYEVLSHTDTWDPAEAQEFAAAQIARFGDEIQAFYSANDPNALGAISAMKAAGMELVPTTGYDATLAAVQRILAGDQYMTVYNSVKDLATNAAEVAIELARGQTPQSNDTINGIPAILGQPTAVTAETIEATVMADGIHTVEEICTPEYVEACEAQGLLE